MSTLDELFVHRDNGSLTTVFLGKRAASDLFEYLHPKLDEAAPEFSEAFEGVYYGDVLSITSLPEKYFSAVYALIMQACDELESLNPRKEKLKQVLQSDSRYHGEEE